MRTQPTVWPGVATACATNSTPEQGPFQPPPCLYFAQNTTNETQYVFMPAPQQAHRTQHAEDHQAHQAHRAHQAHQAHPTYTLPMYTTYTARTTHGRPTDSIWHSAIASVDVEMLVACVLVLTSSNLLLILLFAYHIHLPSRQH